MSKTVENTPSNATPQAPAGELVTALREVGRHSPHERARVLLRHNLTRALANIMPTQDLLITCKAAAREDRAALLRLLPNGAMQRLWDLDVWSHHRLQPDRLGSWLQTLREAGTECATRQLQNLDTEMLGLLLKVFIQVHEAEASESLNLGNAPHAFTPDRQFLLVSRQPDRDVFDCLGGFIELLYGTKPLFATRLLQAIRWETPSSLEEAALHWRDARLQDLGFLPCGDCQRVLTYTNPQRALKQLTTAARPSSNAQTPNPLSRHLIPARLQAVVHNAAPHSLKQALDEIDDAQALESIARQLMVLTNRVHAAWHKDLGDEEELGATVRHTLACLRIALETLSQTHKKTASHWLLQSPLQQLFQLGRSLPLHLAKQLRKAARTHGIANLAALTPTLDHPLRETVQGLLRREPVLYGELVPREKPTKTKQPVTYRPFESLQDIATAAQATTEAAFRLTLLWGNGGIAATSKFNGEEARSFTCATLLATWMSNGLLAGKPKLRPLRKSELAALRQLVRQRGAAGNLPDQLRVKACGWVARWAEEHAPLPGAATVDEAASRAGHYAELALRTMQEELASITDSMPDLRYVHSVWVKPNQNS